MQPQQCSEIMMLATAYSSDRCFPFSVTEFTILSFQRFALFSLLASHQAAVLKIASKGPVLGAGSLEKKTSICQAALIYCEQVWTTDLSRTNILHFTLKGGWPF